MEWLFVMILGLSIGSFIAAFCVRFSQKQSIFGRSQCMFCHTKLKPYHLIPILSFLLLRGKCSSCKQHISCIYPVIELFGLVISMGLFSRFGMSKEYAILLVVFMILLAASTMDYQYQQVSGGLLFSGLAIVYGYLFYIDSWLLVMDSLSIVGIVALLAAFLQSLRGHKSIGEGDFVAIAISSAILGAKFNYLALLMASSMALVTLIYTEQHKIAFIPFLSIATFVMLFWIP